ncbi:hypothetical protein IAD21_04003 [Abditibacteriota bacterium]|nr:hypothetical protein IAD21_04003 [Abditibacteriota bacterium]
MSAAQTNRSIVSTLVAASLLLSATLPTFAQSDLPPAPPAASNDTQGDLSATSLIGEAIGIAESNSAARVVVTRSAAALLPRLPAESRDDLSRRWLAIAMSPSVPRSVRSDALAAFFDGASRTDAAFAERFALGTPDAAARAGGLIQVSRAVERTNWIKSDRLLGDAIRAARSEPELTPRARALVFAAYRAGELNPARQEETVREASSQVNLIGSSAVKDNLLVELSGAAARYDLQLARTLASRISDPGLKNLATARIGLSEISQTSLRSTTTQRVQALATAAAPYDARALPVLLQLPAQPDVLKAISQTLPAIYPSARPAIDISQLENLWGYAGKAPAGVYRDQLQSRLARLMVTKDLWRGRDWGKQLSWKGGRIQVGAFLKAVLEARRSKVGAAQLQDTAQRDVRAAYDQSQGLSAPARAEALLLLAGQVLG